jgi:hypothetical protein
MAAIPTIDEIASKWTRVTPTRNTDYQLGIEAPGVDWKTATSAANDAYKTGVQTAITEDRFNKGVGKAGTTKWQTNTLAKGINRWSEGIQLSGPAYSAGFGPFVNAIKALVLPPRFARRDPRNLARVNAVVNAMVNTAKAQQG